MNMGTHMTLGENRVLFGLWALMKAPLLLSADLPHLPADIQQIILSPELIAINQDALGTQARKLLLDGQVMPWLVGLEDCALGVGGGAAGMRNRGWQNSPPPDTRVWTAVPHATTPGAFALVNAATGRCLAPGQAAGAQTVVLLPCNATDAAQAWVYGTGGAQTVAALVHAASGLALEAGNTTLYSTQHGGDQAPLPDAAFGATALSLGAFLPTQPCTARGCEGYFPQQLWYGPDALEGFIAQSTYTSSINHCFSGDCYDLTPRTPTYRHHCLAHVLSTANAPSDSGNQTEVWGGPLAGGGMCWGSSTWAHPLPALQRPLQRWACLAWAAAPPFACASCGRPPAAWAALQGALSNKCPRMTWQSCASRPARARGGGGGCLVPLLALFLSEIYRTNCFTLLSRGAMRQGRRGAGSRPQFAPAQTAW